MLDADSAPARRADGPAGPRHRAPGAATGRGPRHPARPSSTSARTWSGGCGSASAAGAGARDHRPARRGAGGRRARRPPAAHRQGHRPLHPGRRRRGRPRAALTFHGFRYAEVTGWPGDLDHEDARGRRGRLRPGAHRAGSSAPTPLLNRLHENVVWSMRGNFVDVPTDCPQRDERLGWTGDIQVFAPTASLPLRHRRRSSTPGWPTSPPSSSKPTARAVRGAGRARDTGRPPATAAWGDAAIVRALGAVPALRRRGAPGAAVTEHARLGRPDAPTLAGDRPAVGPAASSSATGSTRPHRRTTPLAARPTPDVVATAYLARSAELARRDGRACWAATRTPPEYDAPGRPGPRRLSPREYVTAGRARAVATAQTGYALASQWALLPDERQRGAAGDRLADLVAASGFRISTGFVGTPLMLRRAGRHRTRRRRLPPAAADRLPVVALPGDDGRDHDLGALGQHAARRQRSTPAR